jgi:NAD(P)-dependent dehydrogenase (short-subunit alcohol dehydrogenase family)
MSSAELSGQVAIVTGAAYGLGRAIAEKLAANGAAVVLSDIDDRLSSTENELRERGYTVSSTVTDVCDRFAVNDCVRHALDAYGRLDIVVNNAGYSRTTLPIVDMDVDEWERTMQINVRGALFFMQESAPPMNETGGGRIVNIASTAAFRPYRFKSPYCVSKSAVVALTRAAALEFAEYKITVNAVAPGQTDTETTRLLQSDPAYGEAMKKRADAIPLGMGQPEDVADTVHYFATAAAKHVTGQTILVDGGTLLV